MVGKSLRFEVQVTNYGNEDARDVKVNISVDNDPPSEDTTIDVVPGKNGSKSISVFPKLRTEGYHTVTARIAASDRVPADDARTVAVRAINEVKVLLVDGNPGSENRESASFFLKNALQPVPPTEREQYFIKVNTIGTPELDTVKFGDYQVVALADVSDFGKTTADALDQYVKGGGGLLIFPGPLANRNFYNKELLTARNLLPAGLGDAYGDEAEKNKDNGKFFILQGKNLEHVVMSLWNDVANGRLTTAKFYKAYELIPAAVKTDAKGVEVEGAARVMLSFDKTQMPGAEALAGKPAIMERAVGSGRVVMFASSSNTKWNDLLVQAHLAVPLTQRVLATLAQRQDEHLTIKVGEKFVHKFPADYSDRDATITKPGQKAKDARDTRKLEMSNRQPTLEYDHTDVAGAYELTVGGDDKPVRFAAQADPAESRLDRLTPDQLKLLAENAHVVEWKPGIVLEDKLKTDRVGVELWIPFVFAALLLAAAETMLAHWFSRSK